MSDLPDGCTHFAGYFSRAQQDALVADIQRVVSRAPLYVPTMPRTGRPFSVRMTNCGPLGWVSSKDKGYRYEARHPETGTPWPPIPALLDDLWRDVAGYDAPPEACLVNWYEPGAKLGLHVDADEDAPDAPVVSVSLGDNAWFRVGGLKRRDPTCRVLLRSGDVIVLGGASRVVHHGIDRILPGTSDLLVAPGRFNLTLRRVTKPDVAEG